MVPARVSLLIDGYNLMHAAGFARERYGPRDLERQRERFLGWLWRRVPPNLRDRTVIVFDAGGTDAQYVGQGTHRELRLLYSPQGREADDVIEELIDRHPAPKQLQVVSSDHRLHKAARRRRATCLDSEAFVGLMARIIRQARERQRELEEQSKPSGELAEETQEWLAVFAEADELLASAIEADDAVKTERPPHSPPAPAITSEPARGVDAPSETTEPGTTLPGAPGIDADELAFWEARIQELLEPASRRPR